MPKINYKGAVDYLLRVIQEWPAFCKQHPCFAESVTEILNENKRLHFENERLKEELKK